MHNLIFIEGLRIKGLLDDDRVMEIGIGKKEDGTESRGVMSDEKASESANVITVIAVSRRHHSTPSAGGNQGSEAEVVAPPLLLEASGKRK